jgi:hypothetical protein
MLIGRRKTMINPRSSQMRTKQATRMLSHKQSRHSKSTVEQMIVFFL